MGQYDFKFHFDGDEYVAEYFNLSRFDDDPIFRSYNLAFTKCDGYEENETEFVVTLAAKIGCKIDVISYEGYNLFDITIEHGTRACLEELASWKISAKSAKMSTKYRTYLFPDKIMCNQEARNEFAKSVFLMNKSRALANESLSGDKEMNYATKETVWASRSCFDMANASMRITAELLTADEIDSLLAQTTGDPYDVTLMKAEIAAEFIRKGFLQYSNTTSYMEIYS